MEDTSETKPATDVATPTSEAVVAPAESESESREVPVGGASASGQEGAHDAGSEADDDADGSDGPDSEGPSAAADGDAGDGTKKRKRRRRRKRKPGAGEGAVEGAASAAEGQEHPHQRKREPSNAPFARYFGQHQGKRHAFAVGEVIAGRVVAVADGAISVDLFGKAMAIAEANEPRELPVEPPSTPVATEADAGGSSDPVAASDETPVVASVAAEGEAVAAETAVAMPIAVADEVAVSHEHDAETQSAIDAVMAEAETEEAEAEASDTAAGAVDAPELPAEAEPLPELEPPVLGQIFKGRIGAIAESGHIAILNRIIDVPAARARVERCRQERRRVLGLVYGFNRGGFDVLVEGLRAFCPVSGMSLGEVDDPNAYVAKHLEFSLPPAKAGTRARDIIVSRRTILEKQQRRAARDLVRTLHPGQRITGKVTQVRDFGVFVDIGGVEGLIHQSELSHNRSVRTEDAVTVGEVIEVQVLNVAVEPRKERRARISLSLKALQSDPWEQHGDAVSEGAVHTGKVTTVTDFGAFIEIVPGVEGLLHISELGRELKHANQVLNIGDEVPVVVERADRKTRRISLSKLSPSELAEHEQAVQSGENAAPKSLRQGETIKVKIEKVEPRGIFVRVAGVIGRRGRAYLPAAETGTDRGADLRKRFPAGTELEVKVIGNDRDGGLRVSVKALAVDEERKAIKDYRKAAAKQGFGTFGDLLRAKLDSTSK